MPNKLKLGIDIDGVLANFNLSFRELVHEHTDVRLPEISDTYPDAWDYHERAGVKWKDDDKLWDVIKNSPTFWKDVPAYPDASRFLEWLAWLPSEVDVYFVTSRPGLTAKAQTEVWLERNGWGYDCHPTVLISSEKGAVANALELTHFIDDRNENCLDIYMDAPDGIHNYMLARPWNQKIFGVPRLDSLDAFRQIVESDLNG
jgi:hypothetical protein